MEGCTGAHLQWLKTTKVVYWLANCQNFWYCFWSLHKEIKVCLGHFLACASLSWWLHYVLQTFFFQLKGDRALLLIGHVKDLSCCFLMDVATVSVWLTKIVELEGRISTWYQIRHVERLLGSIVTIADEKVTSPFPWLDVAANLAFHLLNKLGTKPNAWASSMSCQKIWA